jgi:hypothetical protein
MSTSSVQAAEAGVKELSRDPVTAQFVARLASLVEAWFSRQGHVVEKVELQGDYLLNGNLGKQSAFIDLKNPHGGSLLIVACEVRVFSKDDTVHGFLRVRQIGKGPNPWKFRDSAQVDVHYPSCRGQYKLQLLTQRLGTLLGLNEQTESLEDTLVPVMIDEVMAEARASLIA